MTDEIKTDKLPETPGTETATDAAATTSENQARTFTQEQVNEIVKQRLVSEKRKAQELADKARAEAAAAEAEKSGEWKVLAEQQKKQLEEMQATIQAKDLESQRQKAALQAGIPELADRIRGTTLEEMTEDAAQLATMFKKPVQNNSTTSLANPGGKTALTRQAIESMTSDEINKNWDAVSEFLKGNKP